MVYYDPTQRVDDSKLTLIAGRLDRQKDGFYDEIQKCVNLMNFYGVMLTGFTGPEMKTFWLSHSSPKAGYALNKRWHMGLHAMDPDVFETPLFNGNGDYLGNKRLMLHVGAVQLCQLVGDDRMDVPAKNRFAHGGVFIPAVRSSKICIFPAFGEGSSPGELRKSAEQKLFDKVYGWLLAAERRDVQLGKNRLYL